MAKTAVDGEALIASLSAKCTEREKREIFEAAQKIRRRPSDWIRRTMVDLARGEARLFYTSGERAAS